MNPALQDASRSPAMDTSAPPARRLLVPLTADEDSRWGVAYARQLHAAGTDVEVCLLNVGETVHSWELLRSRTEAEIAAFQADRAASFIEEAGRSLGAEGILFRGLFRRGEVVFTLLDVAEELQCDEIVVPRSQGGLLGCLSRGIVADIRRRQRRIPIVTVDAGGRRVDDRRH